MKKALILFPVLIALSGSAQQDPLYSQYQNNPLIFNPAYAGLNNTFNASLAYRYQWAGFDANPTTANLNSHLSLVDNRVGAGVMVIQDKMGPTKNTEVHFQGAYKLHLDQSNKYTFSFGMQFGFVNFTSNYAQLNLDPTRIDPSFSQNLNLTSPNIGAGAILQGEKFIVGLSVPRMLEASESTGASNYQVYNQHFYLYGSYVHYLGTRFRLKPSILFRGVQGAPLSTDINFNINIDTRYTAGAYTRNFRSYGLLLQAWFLDKLRFGYTFELPTSASVGPMFTSHEITLGIKTAILGEHDRSYSEF